jgi:hypothetical protein
MTATLATACLVTGLIAGWFLRTVIIMAEISYHQEQMQRKVRYWQSEAAYARSEAERHARQLRGLGYPPEAEGPPHDDA